MRTYARALFGIVAVLNLVVGLALVLVPARVVAFAGLGPVQGADITLVYFAGTMIALFGYGYARIAADPVGYRPLIHIGAAGKLLAIASAALPWALGLAGPRLVRVLAPDAVFAILFLDYLRRTAKRR